MENLRIVAKNDKNITLLLYGAIGEKIDGDYFAQEINNLGHEYAQITIRINSEGGSVLQGLSIFNAIANSPAYTIAQIDGIAASMAGVIPMAADEIRMNDFARIMIHNPFMAGKSKPSPKEQKALDNLRAMLTTLLSKRGMPEAKMAELMDQETWFTAEDALALKLIDQIIPTGKMQEVNASLSLLAASSITAHHFNNFIDTPQTNNDMKIISSLFGLPESANELEIAAKIKELQSSLDAQKEAGRQLKELADQLKAEKEVEQKAQVETLTDKAIAAGFFSNEQRESLIESGIAHFDAFKKLINSLQKPAVGLSLSQAINRKSENEILDVKQDFEWYRRNDPLALAEMKIKDGERFAKLYAAWEKENA